jgi:undecaprenyl-diphosphatase
MDRRLLFLINHEWTNPSLDWLMAFLSSISVWMPIIIAGVVALIIFGGFRARAFIVCTAIVFGVNDGLCTQLLKDWAGRPRPYEVLSGVRIVDIQEANPAILGLLQEPSVTVSRFSHTPPRGRSYPSGHVANNFALAILLTVFFPRWGALYFLMAFAVSYSRIYVGAHWPSDVIGSAVQGMAVAMLGIAFSEWAWRRWVTHSSGRLQHFHPSLILNARE